MDGGATKPISEPRLQALPTSIPEPPDFTHLPVAILHTGTVETLIGHNEDLTARLMVNIRKNSVLEAQILEQERANTELAQMNSAMASQIEVFQEKDRIWKTKSSQVGGRYESLRQEAASLEEKILSLENANAYLKEAARAGIRFQRRVRSWVRPFIDRVTSELKSETQKRLAAEGALNDAQVRLANANQDLKHLENKFMRDQTKLVEQYEGRLAGLHNVKEKAKRFDEAVAKRTELENKIVLMERLKADGEATLAGEINVLQSQMTQYRQEAKTLAVENTEMKKELEKKSAEFDHLSDQYMRLQDQFESMQSVWSESQRRLEASKLQQETLNKLNQELSRQLKDFRAGRAQQSSEVS